MLKTIIFTVFAVISSISYVHAQESKDNINPEISTGISKAKMAMGEKFMVVTADPYATRAAYNVLKSGGTAADAAITAQLILGLTEPQSSGLGGGAFVLYFDAATKKLTTLDGRETAPASVTEDYFLTEDGEPMAFWGAVLSGKSVGVPGTPKLLEALHMRFGKKDWGALFDEPLKLANGGFKISERLHSLIEADKGKLDQQDFAKTYFYTEDGEAKPANSVLRNPEYAKALDMFRSEGAKVFYDGPLAYEIIKTSNSAGGGMTLFDLANYKVIEREPVCDVVSIINSPDKKICSMAEPSSGGLTVLQILKLMEYAQPEDNMLKYIEASRLAFADRNAYIADPDYINYVPLANYLLDEDYVQSRAALIGEEPASEVVAGNPFEGKLPPQQTDREEGTSHISIVDQYGNVLSMTTTVENAFGSRLMANGFILNNELTDFAFTPEIDGQKVANRPQANKRPRSSMAPTIVFDANNETPEFVIGSAGGSRIIGYVAHKILQHYEHPKHLGDVLATPHLLARGDLVELEETSKMPESFFEKMGYQVEKDTQTSGMTAISIRDGKIYGAADPRRNGLALGE